MSSSPRNTTEPTAQRLTIASCRSLVSCSGSGHDLFPQDTTYLHRAARLLGLVTAPRLDASAIRDFVDSLVTELERQHNDTLADFAEEVLESLCLLELHSPSEDRAIRRRVLAARGRMLVLGYRSCVGDRYRNALRRSVEVLHLIRADPPPLLELQRLRRTLWQEWPKEGSDFVRVVWLARKALEMLGGSERARLRELVKEFDLEDPPGAFYALRGKDEPVGRPLAGFFVNRLTGSVRHVSGKELWDAGMELGPLGLRLLVIPENRSDLQMVVRHLLTRRPGPRTRRSNAAPDDRSRGKWWQVWK